MDGDKITRITEALYRVTDLMPDQEPLKWSLRRRAIVLMNFFLGNSSDRVFKDNLQKRERAFSTLSELLGMLDVASSNTFISRINFEVLSREYRVCREHLKISKELETPLLNEEEKLPSIAEEPKSENNISLDENVTMLPESSHRKEKILRHLGGNGWVSIGKLVEIFENQFSEKTIQRDLVGLMEAGLIKREGDKRWRRYTVLSDIPMSDSDVR